jgi:ribosomal-protein-alanine acetyltransferase
VTEGVRAAVAGDAPAIAALEARLFAGSAWSEQQVREELTGHGRRGWVVAPATGHEVDGPPLRGYVIMRTVGDVSDLQRIGVAPELQRAGLAARLLAAASAGVREEGAERILLEVAEDNAPARAFYARAGFVEIDRRPRYYRHEVAALVLQKVLEE